MNSILILAHEVKFPIERHRRLEFAERIKYLSQHFQPVHLVSTEKCIKKYQIKLQFDKRRNIYLYRVPKNEFIAALQCARIIKNLKPSAIICDSTSDARKAILSKFFYNFPMIVFTISFDTEMYLYSTRLRVFRNSYLKNFITWILHLGDIFIFNLSDGIICVSPALVKYINRFLLRNTNDKLRFIPNSYSYIKDIPENSLIKMQQKLDSILKTFEKKQHVLLYVGDFVYNKRPDIAISTLKILHSKFNDIILFLIGDGPMKQDLQNYAQKLGLSNKIFFLGKLPQYDTIAMISMADIVINPSISEGFSSVIAETMSLKIPVVAFAQQSVKKLCENRDIELIYNHNPHNYAKLIQKILKNPTYRKNFIKISLETIEPYVNYTTTKRLQSIYAQIAETMQKSKKVSLSQFFRLFLQWFRLLFRRSI